MRILLGNKKNMNACECNVFACPYMLSKRHVLLHSLYQYESIFIIRKRMLIYFQSVIADKATADIVCSYKGKFEIKYTVICCCLVFFLFLFQICSFECTKLLLLFE